MIVVKTNKFRVLWMKKSNAFTIFPFIFILPFDEYMSNLDDIGFGLKHRETYYSRTLNHEKIHIRQQIETLLILFTVLYFTELALRFLFCFNFKKAYRKVSFEKEAYENSSNLNYLKYRKFWSFIKYL